MDHQGPAFSQIDRILSDISEQLSEGKVGARFTLTRRSERSCVLAFPGRTAEQAWRFTVVVRLLSLIQQALLSNVVVSKRDLYYRDPDLFGSQDCVDRYVDDIAYTLRLPRAALNVAAARKGLMFGPIIFQQKDGSIIDMRSAGDAMLVPDDNDILFIDTREVDWVLVIEKEATFGAVKACVQMDSFLAKSIIITAKGYPDIATRQLLNLLVNPNSKNAWSSKPTFALVDCDPDGLNIYGCYKYKSPTTSTLQPENAIAHMRLLGLSFDQLSFDTTRDESRSILSLTARDRTRAVNMLQKSSAGREHGVRLELQRMLMLNIKAELQHLDEQQDELRSFLWHSIHGALTSQ